MDLRERYDAATAHLDPPFAIVDMEAFRANAADLVRRAGGKPIRVASKSVRSRALLRMALATDGMAGIMAFTLPEALWLAAEEGAAPDATPPGGGRGGGRGGGPSGGGRLCDDILVAYPTTDASALVRLAGDERAAATITVMVDCADHLDLIEKAGAVPARPIRICMDIDAGWRALGGRIRIGARRSPLRTPEQVAALAREIVGRPALRLTGLMAYEGQIAGVGDNPPGKPLTGRAIRFVKARSCAELAHRRAAIVAAVREILGTAATGRAGRAGDDGRADQSEDGGRTAQSGDGGGYRAPAGLEFVNGGGTGSVELTAAEPAVTEITAGSGLYQSVLFDHYSNFRGRPAAAFALPVVRRPGPGAATVLGGGYLASGPGDRSRLPQPYLPAGLAFDPHEGAGEVQTPLLGAAADRLRIGDRVWFRHAKAGELCERFAELYLIEGEKIVDTVPTYRGEGKTFL
jgi:D-serine deaminase-like pyridoxal phosphate-dependent protein